MKKLIYKSLFLAIVGIGVVGCKKETITQDSREITPEFEASKNLVSFKSIESYENFINNYEEEQKEIAFEELNKSGFQNYFTKQENLVLAKNDDSTDSDDYEMDDRFGLLLNQDGVIRIGDYLFKVNLPEEEVRAVSYTNSDSYSEALALLNSSSKEVLLFSTDDDVLDIITTGMQEKCGGSSSFNEWSPSIYDGFIGGNYVRFQSQYFKSGIYFSVRIRGRHYHGGSGIYTSNPTLTFEVSPFNPNWKALRVRRRPCGSGHATYHHGGIRTFQKSGVWSGAGSNRYVVFKAYEGVRALNGYRVWIRGYINGNLGHSNYIGREVNSNF